MDPINYNVDVKSPFEQSMAGFQGGVTMQKDVMALQTQNRANELAKQLQIDLAGLARKPDAKASDFAGMMIKYPQLSEHFKRGWDTLNGEQQASKLSSATQVYAAVNSGRPDIASQLLTEQAAALRNSGKEDEAKAAETMAKFIEMDPKSAKTTTGLLLSSLMGPEKFAETFTKLEKEGRDAALQPSALTEAQEKAKKAVADTKVAEITARYGEQNAITDLAKKGWDIKKIEADIGIGKENNRIAAMNAATNRMNAGTNSGELKVKQGHLNLEIQKATDARDTKIREKVSEVTSARNTIDNMLNTADQILKHPGLKQFIAPTGPMMARTPTMRSDTADFEALMENLDAQAFTSQIPSMKGMGALSDAEGKKLAAALQSFKLTQSPPQLKANIEEAQRLMLKARSNLVTKYGVPDTVPDTPAATPSLTEVDAALKKYGPKKQ